ncbi:hypothetical protein PF007_g20269 [Phytophthora fragariae]|uniref:Uncharacterized protein n=1 Tax=Phytophthora fragariae TaxID=53985 RepID=A0A6A3R2E0_9STRA|nr:hypothetical protein PF007_g20269 [Phytophthora fragariae]
MPPTTQKSTGLKSAGKKPAAKKTRGPRVMLFDFDHGPDTDSSDDGEDARDEGGDSDTAVEPSDEEGDGSSSEEASAKVKTKFWCAYKGCRNPPMVKQSFRRHLEMHLANDNKMRTPKCLNRCGHGLRQSMKAEHTMTKEQLVKDQAKMKKTQGEIRSHVRMDGVVAMVFSLTNPDGRVVCIYTCIRTLCMAMYLGLDTLEEFLRLRTDLGSDYRADHRLERCHYHILTLMVGPGAMMSGTSKLSASSP